jgi:broad specificity phosphatase PhoE
VVDIVRLLLPTYSDRVVFTHQEIWQDVTTQRVSPTVEEWRLLSEPWIFVVDGQGIIRAKFEGLTTAREIATALQQMLDPQ